MNKRVRVIATVFIGLLVFWFSASLLLRTRSATDYLALFIKQTFVNTLKFDHLSGKIWGRLDISHLQIHKENMDIEIGHLSATTAFNPLSLMVTIKQLQLTDVAIKPHFNHADDSNPPFTFNSFFRIKVNQLSVINSKIILKGHAYQLPPIQATLSLDSKGLLLSNLSASPSISQFVLKMHADQLLLRLQIAINKAQCFLNINKNKHQTNIHANVIDSQDGTLQIIGKGKNKVLVLNISASQFNFQHILPDYWPSKLTFNLSLNKQDVSLQAKLIHLQGTLHSQPISAAGYFALTNNNVDNIHLQLQSPFATLAINDNPLNPTEITWLANFKNLTTLFPHSKGTITSKGIFSHTLNPKLAGEFKANDLQFSQLSVRQTAGDFAYSFENAPAHLYISATDLLYKNNLINHIKLFARGTLTHHDLTLQAETKKQQIDMHLTGQQKEGDWYGTVDHLAMYHESTRWHLQNSFIIKKVATIWSIDKLRLAAKNSLIWLQGSYDTKKGINGQLFITNLPLALFNFLLPKEITLTGNLNLKAQSSLSSQKLLIAANMQSSACHYVLNDEPHQLFIHKGNLLLDLQQNKLNLQSMLISSDGQLSMDITTQRITGFEQLKNNQIQGQLSLNMANAAMIESFIPAIKNVKATIKGEAAITGTFAKPLMNGKLDLINGSFKIPKLNLDVKDVSLSAMSDMKNIIYKGSLSVGNGKLNLQGQGPFDNKSFALDLALTGNQILICNTPQVKIMASPLMHLLLKENRLVLTGDLLIPQATINLHDFNSKESSLDDIVYIQSDGKPVETSNLKIASNINLTLGEHILLNTHGIKGQVLGQLKIQDDPSKATIAYGQLWLQNGSYSVYGKTLDINNGKLVFTGGPITNPGINIKASRTLKTQSSSLFQQEEQIKVGVSVMGTMQNPKMTLFSEPTGKSQEDIFSYLILGMPVNSINKSVSQANTRILLQAADALNFSGNNTFFSMKNNLQKSLGLEELDIDSQYEINPSTQETVHHTAFVLGKYLSPKFYVNYSLDLFDHTNTFKIRYLLNKFWTVQSIANTTKSGIDILYTVEKQ